MPRNLITDPQDGFDSFVPSEDDWQEFWEYVQACEREEADREFEEANRELSEIESPV